MQDYWNDNAPHPPSPGLDAVLGHAGVTQYRGWFRALEDRYPKASDAQVADALERFDARLAVVGHTIVPGVERMRNGRVYAVDVNSDESATRSEEHTSELQSLMRISYAVFCLKKKTRNNNT